MEYNTDIYEESIRDTKNKIMDKLFLLKDRNLSKEVKTAVVRNLDDTTFDMLQRGFSQLRTVETYGDYKKLFNSLCKAMKIPSENCILVSEEFKKGTKGNDNTILIKYSNKTKKIIIPAGYTLYHQTTQDISDSRELRPTFRGKSAKGYLYSSPRVYFSLRKLPKVAADILNNETTSIWVPKEKIQVAYIDPLLPNAMIGAIYVETRYPIAVKPYEPEEGLVKEDSVEDPTSIEFIESFMKENGLIFSDDKIYEEGVRSTIGVFARKLDAHKTIKENWKAMEKTFAAGDKTIMLDEKQYDELKRIWEIAKKTSNFSVYKNAFGEICKAFGLPPSNTVINNCEFKKRESGQYSGWIRYNSGKRKIIIPNGTVLIHSSSTSGISSLNPTFRSRTEGRFLYSSQRIYFTLGKPIDPEKGGFSSHEKLHRYTPTNTIQTAYIDPAAKEFERGAVFVETTSPIPVITLEKFSEKFFKTIMLARKKN